MNQSAILAASLLAGFGLFVASRDRLPVYARILWGEKPGTHSEPQQDKSEDTLGFGDAFKGFELPSLPDFGDYIPDFNWDLGQ
jgi:hypothetical protein